MNAKSKAISPEKVFLGLYLAIFFGIALSIACNQALVNTPPDFVNPPDEHARYLVPKFIYEHGRIPSGYNEEVRIPMFGFSYAVYNVLSYVIMAGFMKVASLFGASEVGLLISARLVNVIFGTCMAYVIYLLSKELFKKQSFGWLFSVGVMFWPQHLFLHTYVNTDSMAQLSTAIILYAIVLLYKNGFSFKRCLLLGLGITCCALSYYNSYGFIVFAFIMCVGYFWKKSTDLDLKSSGKKAYSYDYKSALRWAGIMVAIVFVGTGWWYIHNAIVYDGDLFGLRTVRIMTELYAAPEIRDAVSVKDMGLSIIQMFWHRDCAFWYYVSFISVYGSMTMLIPKIWYLSYAAFAAVGLFLYAVQIPFYRKDNDFHRVLFHVGMILTIIIPVGLSLYYSYCIDFQPQGRYLMPMIVSLIYYIVKGYERLFERAFLGKINELYINRIINCFAILFVIMLIVIVFKYYFPLYLQYGVQI